MDKKNRLIYRDAVNYAPIDVVKGIDLLTKEIVMADDEAPADYERKAKCKYCKKFTFSDDGNTGQCQASKNMFIAYPDMFAVTCENYDKKD